MSGIRFSDRRISPFACVLVLAFALAAPEAARGADAPAPVIAKAPATVPPPPRWEWFLEGAGFWTAGDRLNIVGMAHLPRPGFGWEGAIGFDYRAALSPWHVSGQFRYGRAGSRSWGGPVTATVFIPGPTVLGGTASGDHREHHWVADLAIGQDVATAVGPAQAKIGIRVAELSAKSTAAGTLSFVGDIDFAIAQRSRFLGIGPRAALEGSLPMSGPWSIEYMGGVAVLFGDRKLVVADPLAIFAGSSADSGAVLNADGSVAVSYAVTPNLKVSAGYRLDGYWNALRTFDAGLNVVHADRIFHGPFIRATGQF